MYKSILEDLVCPKCKSGLSLEILEQEQDEIIEGKLICKDNHTWIIKDGVINFESQEQEIVNNWSEHYKNINYDELDKMVKEATPDNQLEGYNISKQVLLEKIKCKHAKNIIDIGTGRGMLLTYIAKNITDEISLVCVDLSYEVLKYDRLKVKKINPKIKVNYIACDAARLPFKENSFDLSVSFFGIINMGEIAKKGVEEAVRVSKEGLINAVMVIKDDNPKVETINKYLQDDGIDGKIDNIIETNCFKLHQVDGKYNVTKELTYESVALPSKYDYVPIEGEWFGINVYDCKEN
ncbi:class I SAM-dependent methyltransferase [Clostridiaceae bacterium M8S5]|nr:class I SAM-dependent methyltransferase [Clostridiaceae bacterium M8S5]